MTSMLPLYGRLLLAGALVLASGCDDDSFQETKSTNVSVSPGSIDYDPEPPGRQSVARAIEIRQDGEQPLSVTAVYLESTQFTGARQCDRVSLGLGRNDALPTELDENCHFMIEERAGGRAFPWVLGNNESLVVNVTYRSIGDTDSGWKLIVESNALDRERVEVDLRVRREQPEWGGTSLISFPIDGGSEFGVIRNSGSGLLNVADFRVEYITPQPVDPMTQQVIDEFRVRADSSLPWNVNNQQAQTFSVTYTPADDTADIAEIVFVSENATTPEYRVRLTSEAVTSVLDVQPNPAIFGVPVLAERDKRVVMSISNRGLKSLNIESILIDQPNDEYRIEDGPVSFQLQAGQSQELLLVYRPGSMEGSDASLLITSDADQGADDQRLTVVPLLRSGEALPALLDVEPPVVTLNDVAFGSTGSQVITLSNPGAQPLTISRLSLSTAEDAVPASDAEFTLTRGAGPTTIEAGASHEVEVQLSRGAEDRNARFAALIIESNATPNTTSVYITSSPPAGQ